MLFSGPLPTGQTLSDTSDPALDTPLPPHTLCPYIPLYPTSLSTLHPCIQHPPTPLLICHSLHILCTCTQCPHRTLFPSHTLHLTPFTRSQTPFSHQPSPHPPPRSRRDWLLEVHPEDLESKRALALLATLRRNQLSENRTDTKQTGAS